MKSILTLCIVSQFMMAPSHAASTAKSSLRDYAAPFARAQTVSQMVEKIKPSVSAQTYAQLKQAAIEAKQQRVKIEAKSADEVLVIADQTQVPFAVVDAMNGKYMINNTAYVFDHRKSAREQMDAIINLLPRSHASVWSNLLPEAHADALVYVAIAGAIFAFRSLYDESDFCNSTRDALGWCRSNPTADKFVRASQAWQQLTVRLNESRDHNGPHPVSVYRCSSDVRNLEKCLRVAYPTQTKETQDRFAPLFTKTAVSADASVPAPATTESSH